MNYYLAYSEYIAENLNQYYDSNYLKSPNLIHAEEVARSLDDFYKSELRKERKNKLNKLNEKL